MRILLTAFEPFDESGLNASLEGCRCFLERWGGAWDLRFAVLPVRYDADTAVVDAALSEGEVDLALHTGQGSGSQEVRVERIAVNLRYPDDAPGPAGHHPIVPGGPVGVLATIPVDEVAAAIRAAGVPAGVSNHAGIYLCNHVLYRSLLREAAPRVGFVHVPRLPEQTRGDERTLPAEQVAAAIQAALTCLTNPRP